MMVDVERSNGFEKYLEISNREKSELKMYHRSFGLDIWIDGSVIYGNSTRGGIGIMMIWFSFGHLSLGSLWNIYEEMSCSNCIYESET